MQYIDSTIHVSLESLGVGWVVFFFASVTTPLTLAVLIRGTLHKIRVGNERHRFIVQHTDLAEVRQLILS